VKHLLLLVLPFLIPFHFPEKGKEKSQ